MKDALIRLTHPMSDYSLGFIRFLGNSYDDDDRFGFGRDEGA